MPRARSVLFVPGSAPRALEKARHLPCDVVVLDLEDAVAPPAKADARRAVAAAIGAYAAQTMVRVNAPDSPWLADDLAAILPTRPAAILAPKLSSAAEARDMKARIGDIALWAMIETPRALLAADAIAGSGAAALVLGTNDLLKHLGGRHMPGRENLFHAMGHCVAAARAHGLIAIDGVHNDLDDAQCLALACRQARDFGFAGKSLIHPSQIAPVHHAFTPTPAEIAEAQGVIAALDADPHKGAVAFRGRMIEALDGDIARRTLALADALAR